MVQTRLGTWTNADVAALPYDEWHRYELIDGELYVSTAPRYEHQMTQKRITAELDRWNDVSQLGEVIPTPGVIFGVRSGVIPDVVWVSRERLASSLDAEGHLQGAPELVIEVLSPGSANARRDRQAKLGLYARHGVAEYWLLDWRTTTIAVYRRDAAGLTLLPTLAAGDTLTSPLLPEFSLPVAHVFRW